MASLLNTSVLPLLSVYLPSSSSVSHSNITTYTMLIHIGHQPQESICTGVFNLRPSQIELRTVLYITDFLETILFPSRSMIIFPLRLLFSTPAQDLVSQSIFNVTANIMANDDRRLAKFFIIIHSVLVMKISLKFD